MTSSLADFPRGEAPFRAMCGTEAWTLGALPCALAELASRGGRLRRAEAWVVFEDGTYGVFILHQGGERLMYSWEPSSPVPCLVFAHLVAHDGRILPEMRDRLRFALFAEGAAP